MKKRITNGKWLPIFPLALAGLLCACETTSSSTRSMPATWIKPGANQNDVSQAMSECQWEEDRVMWNQPPAGTDARLDNLRKEVKNSCLRGKGLFK